MFGKTQKAEISVTDTVKLEKRNTVARQNKNTDACNF